MKNHPYLRAYMAGVLLPSWFLLLVLAAFLLAHFTRQAPARLETAIIFPMAIVPNLWGLSNVLYSSLRLRGQISIGAFGSRNPAHRDGHLLLRMEIRGGVLQPDRRTALTRLPLAARPPPSIG